MSAVGLGNGEGPHNRVLAVVTARDVQEALGDRMPPDDGNAAYPRWEAAINEVMSTAEGRALGLIYVYELARDLANLVATQMAAKPNPDSETEGRG